MIFDDGDGFVRCARGDRHWGVYGAAGLLLDDPARGVLLQRRARWVHHGGTWALPGGAIRSTETARAAALREAGEEAAVDPAALTVTAAAIDDHGGWRYTTVLARAGAHLAERSVSLEATRLAWVPPEDVEHYRLHPDFAAAWPLLRPHVGRRLLLLVDGATVAGQRDDLGELQRVGLPEPASWAELSGWWWWPEVVAYPAIDPASGRSAAEAIRERLAGSETDPALVVSADDVLHGAAEASGARAATPAMLVEMLAQARERTHG